MGSVSLTLLRSNDPIVGSLKVETLQCPHMNVQAVPEIEGIGVWRCLKHHPAVLWLLGIVSSIQGEGAAVVLQNPGDSNQNPKCLHTTNGTGTDCS